jgi:hypothetical protein
MTPINPAKIIQEIRQEGGSLTVEDGELVALFPAKSLENKYKLLQVFNADAIAMELTKSRKKENNSSELRLNRFAEKARLDEMLFSKKTPTDDDDLRSEQEILNDLMVMATNLKNLLMAQAPLEVSKLLQMSLNQILTRVGGGNTENGLMLLDVWKQSQPRQ